MPTESSEQAAADGAVERYARTLQDSAERRTVEVEITSRDVTIICWIRRYRAVVFAVGAAFVLGAFADRQASDVGGKEARITSLTTQLQRANAEREDFRRDAVKYRRRQTQIAAEARAAAEALQAEQTATNAR